MKRRGFLKGLISLPAMVPALKAKETIVPAPKQPEPMKTEETIVPGEQRFTVSSGPMTVTAYTMTMSWGPNWRNDG